MITLTGLTKTYEDGPSGPIHAVRDVDLHVAEGEVYGVVGQSGAGKSSLIRCVNLLERPTSGTVEVAGQELTAMSGRRLRDARRRIGMVFQHFNLLSSRTAAENVALGLEIAGTTRRERASRAAEILDLVGLADRADAYPAQLSGGQKQRVGIARALAGRPQVLLSDEATSALDPQTTASILELLREINRTLGLTVLLITHEMEVIKSVCDSAALMREGRLVEQGRITELLAQEGSELAHALFPLGDEPGAPGSTVIEVTFSGSVPDRPVVAALARQFDVEVSILGAVIETVVGRRVGRLRLELPGRVEQHAAPLAWLRDQGLFVDVRSGGAR